LKYSLITSGISILVSIIFLILLITSVFSPRELALFGFFMTIALFSSTMGITLILYTSRVLQWIIKVWSPVYKRIYRVIGLSDEQIENTDSIFFLWSKSGSRYEYIIIKVIGFFLAIIGIPGFINSVIFLIGDFSGNWNVPFSS